MIEFKYISADKTEYDLIGDKLLPTSGYVHSYEWTPKTTSQDIGVAVYGFGKDPITYEITLTFRGKPEERKKALNKITNSFEYDVAARSPGKIVFGNYSIECYIKAASNKVSSTNNSRTDCEISIYCPYPLWSQEETKSFYKSGSGGTSYDYLDYTFDYAYDYSKPEAGTEHWNINHYRSNGFKMVIYGACTNPRIVIEGNVYQVYDTLEEGEHIIVDSRKKTIYKYLTNGTNQNIFYKKASGNSIFTEIPSGEISIGWNGAFGFDITVYKERSVPEWI